MVCMTESESFLSLSDVAFALDVTVRDIVQLIDDGELPSVAFGGHQRVPREALEQYLTDRYEQQRRASLWNESQTASVIDLFGPRAG